MKSITVFFLSFILLSCSSIEMPSDRFKQTIQGEEIGDDKEFIEHYYNFLGYDGDTILNGIISSETNNQKKTLIITHNFVRDDSIKGNKYIFTFGDEDDYNSLSSISRQIKCRKGRGHTWWSGESCY